MKVLFLDIDGVLNANGSYKADSESRNLDPRCVANLNRLVQTTDCKIVLSSAWRYMILNGAMTIKGFQYMLRTHGVTKYLEIIDTLPADNQLEFVAGSNKAPGRGQAIHEWVEKAKPEAKPEKWAIVDDLDVSYGICKECPNFVQTNPNVGLTEEDTTRLLEILR